MLHWSNLFALALFALVSCTPSEHMFPSELCSSLKDGNKVNSGGLKEENQERKISPALPLLPLPPSSSSPASSFHMPKKRKARTTPLARQAGRNDAPARPPPVLETPTAAQQPSSSSSFAGYLLGAGNPLLDITAHVEQSVLDTYGLSVGQAIIAEEKHKALFEELSSSKYKVEHAAGGATLNAIRVAQWLLQEPEATSFIGAVGKDANGSTLRECASKDGVALHLYEADSFATGTCAVLIKDQQHSLVANLAASKQYSHQDHFESTEVQQVVKQAKIIYSAAYFLAVAPATVHALGAHCAAENKIFALSFGAAYIAKSFSEPLLKAIEYSDFIFSTEADVREFAKSQEYHADNVKDIALLIAQLPKESGSRRARVVVVTRGKESTIIAQQTRVIELPVPFQKEVVVDPNGVGDAFVGGFLAALARGLDLQERVNAGHYAASVVSQASGCNPKDLPALDLKTVQAATEKVNALKKSRSRQSEVRTAVRELVQAASNGEEKVEEIKEANDQTEANQSDAHPAKKEKAKKEKGDKIKKDKKKSEKSEHTEKEAKPEKEKKAKKTKGEKDKRSKSEKDEEGKKESQKEPQTEVPEDARADPANAPEEVPAVRVHLDSN